jgi:hypothetical protein
MNMNRLYIPLMFFLITGTANAFPSLKLTATPGTKSFAALTSGELKTINQNQALSPQAVSLDYQGDLANLIDINTAFYSISGVNTTGSANQINNLVSQNTNGGTFSIWTDSTFTNLILSGNLGAGIISGQAGSTAAKYETWSLNVTGGSILSSLSHPMLDLSINYQLDGCLILSKRCFLASSYNPTVGITNGNFNSFTSNLVDGLSAGKTLIPPSTPPPVTPIPEPASLILLALGGGAKFISSRKKNKI